MDRLIDYVTHHPMLGVAAVFAVVVLVVILTAGETFKRFKEKPVVVYCDSGSLAAAAVRQLNAQGFTKAFTLRGGFAGWRAENLPVAKAA